MNNAYSHINLFSDPREWMGLGEEVRPRLDPAFNRIRRGIEPVSQFQFLSASYVDLQLRHGNTFRLVEPIYKSPKGDGDKIRMIRGLGYYKINLVETKLYLANDIVRHRVSHMKRLCNSRLIGG